MKAFFIGMLISIIGGVMLSLAIFWILITVYNYPVILPTSISEFINYYFGESFKVINDISFLGLFGACGAILIYFGIYIAYLFSK
jgi:Na+/H+ antiporter NhaC